MAKTLEERLDRHKRDMTAQPEEMEILEELAQRLMIKDEKLEAKEQELESKKADPERLKRQVNKTQPTELRHNRHGKSKTYWAKGLKGWQKRRDWTATGGM